MGKRVAWIQGEEVVAKMRDVRRIFTQKLLTSYDYSYAYYNVPAKAGPIPETSY